MTDRPIKKSHAYIIASQDVDKRKEIALKLARTMVCDKGGDEPCGICTQCRRALAGVHPDIIFIDRLTDDKGKQRREIYVDQIRDMSADVWVRPQQSEKKIYVIREANLLNQAAQNSALKILEEPPEYAVFILCGNSAEEFLPTVRSRCVIIREAATVLREENVEAAEIVGAAVSGDEAALCDYCWRYETLDGEKSAKLIEACRTYLSEAICRGASSGVSRAQATRLLGVFDIAAEYLHMNVGAKHVWGYISVSAI